MNIFKNGVGRPSNETIKKRNIIKIGGFLLIALVCILLSYSLSKIGTKRLSGAVIKTEDKIISNSTILLNFDYSKYGYEESKIYSINEKLYILLIHGNRSGGLKNYLAPIDESISNEDNWIELYVPENYYIDTYYMQVAKDGSIIYSIFSSTDSSIVKFNLDGTYWKKEILTNERHLFVDDNYIYVEKKSNNIEYQRFDYDGNEQSPYCYTIGDQFSDYSYLKSENNFSYLKSDNNNIYLLFKWNDYNNTLYDIAFVKTDFEGNEIDKKIINTTDLGFDLNIYDGFISLDYLSFMSQEDSFKIYDDRIEYFGYIKAKLKNTSYSENSYKYFSKKIVIDKQSLELSDVVSYSNEALNLERAGNNSNSICLKVDSNTYEETFYTFKVKRETNSSMSIDSHIIITDKNGNFIKDIKDNLTKKINVKNYVFYGVGLFYLDNKFYLEYMDMDKNKLYVQSFELISANGINVEESDGGKLVVKTQGQTFSEGQDIELVVTPNDGNKLKELKFFDKDGNDVTSSITVTNNTFKMPAYGVVVKAIFEKDGNNNDNTTTSNGGGNNNNNNNETTYTTLNKFNPSTYDNIMKFIIIGGVSLIVVGASVILVIKNKKK